MSKSYSEGTSVKWKWGSGYGEGKIKTKYTRKVSRKIAGKEITRNGSEEDPAYYIESVDANNVLKLHSELEKG